MDPGIVIRRAFIDRFASLCEADDRVAALFLSGSYAAGTPDRYSDVDLTLVAAPGAYDRLFEDRWRIMAELGELVLSEDFDGFGRDMLLYLYADGVDGEVELHPRENVSWAEPSKLVSLVDKENVAPDVRPWPTPPVEHRKQRVAWLFSRFWRYVWLGSGAVGRGRLLTAYGYLDAARVCCVNLARLRQDLTSSWSLAGYDKAEDVVGDSDLAALEPSFGPLEARALAAGLTTLIGFFELLARELADRHGLTQPARLAVVARSRLDEVVATLELQGVP